MYMYMYTLHRYTLEVIESSKCLGNIISKDFTRDRHLHQVAGKGGKTLDFLRLVTYIIYATAQTY